MEALEIPTGGSSPRTAWLRIVGLSTGAAVLYGIVHDQVTVRICREYFSVFHPRILDTDDPSLLALFWGVFATWWAGAVLGGILAAAARAGARPRTDPAELAEPVGVLLLAMAGAAAAAGIVGRALARSGAVIVWPPDLAARIPEAEHVNFLTCLWIHNASYAAGFLGGGFLAWRTWRRRAGAPRPPEVTA